MKSVYRGIKTFAIGGILIGLVCLTAYFVSSRWLQLMLIQGSSMEPAYHNLQFVLLQKNVDHYTYGDVVAFWCEDLDAVLVKRIAALPGDAVQICDGTLYVNGVVSEIYPENVSFAYVGIAAEPVMLGEDEYFVIGDNVDESKDSRYEEVGIITANDIIGTIL